MARGLYQTCDQKIIIENVLLKRLNIKTVVNIIKKRKYTPTLLGNLYL